MASTLIRNANLATSNRKTWTWSGWIKKCQGSNYFWSSNNASSNYSTMRFPSDRFNYYDYSSGSIQYQIKTNRLFRDNNAWYHIVLAYDTTQSTASDRIKLYVNGVQETSFTQATYPTQNYDSFVNVSGYNHNLGGEETGQFDGLMSHVHFCDGTALAPTVFGSTDSTTGEWKINTSPSFTLGTNGYSILKDGNTITDQSTNSNDFSLTSGTLTKTEDCPSNVFATFNPLSGADTMAVNTTFSNGNNTVVCSGSVYNAFGSTLGVSKGKWYAEFKTNSAPGDGMIGIFAKLGASGNYLGSQTHQYSWYNASGGKFASNSSNLATSVGTYTTNDIIGIALDCDNNKLYFHKNGTYMTYGGGTMNPTSGTYGISITDPDDTDFGFYFMSAMDWGGSTRGNWSANFGNGYFGSTQISSAGTNASGNGIFEYDVPTSYTALSTKGLNL